MEKFWMVYVERGNCPAFRHHSLESAKLEAERLARLTGRRAYILESVEAAELAPAPIQWVQVDEETTF